MKAYLYFFETVRLEADFENAHMFDENYQYEIPLEVAEKWEQLKKENKEMQKILHAIYTAKNG